jgi:hypothetical protein
MDKEMAKQQNKDDTRGGRDFDRVISRPFGNKSTTTKVGEEGKEWANSFEAFGKLEDDEELKGSYQLLI